MVLRRKSNGHVLIALDKRDTAKLKRPDFAVHCYTISYYHGGKAVVAALVEHVTARKYAKLGYTMRAAFGLRDFRNGRLGLGLLN